MDQFKRQVDNLHQYNRVSSLFHELFNSNELITAWLKI